MQFYYTFVLWYILKAFGSFFQNLQIYKYFLIMILLVIMIIFIGLLHIKVLSKVNSQKQHSTLLLKKCLTILINFFNKCLTIFLKDLTDNSNKKHNFVIAMPTYYKIIFMLNTIQ